MSEAVRTLFLETADEEGWLEERYTQRDFEKAKGIAKKMLLRGRPIEEVAEDTGLPYETIRSLA